MVNQREKQRLETRRTLAEHALRLFRDQGYDETTVEDIASAAGVSPRTFFLHFATKAAAAFPDHDERVADFIVRLEEGADHSNPLPHLCEIMLSGLGKGLPMRRTRYQLLAKVQALRDEDSRTDRDYEAAVVAYLTKSWGSSLEARVRANAIANAVLGVARACLIAWGEEDIDPQRACSEILSRMFGGPFDIPLQSLQRAPRRSPARR